MLSLPHNLLRRRFGRPVCRDNQRLLAPIPAVNDGEHLLHDGILTVIIGESVVIKVSVLNPLRLLPAGAGDSGSRA